MAWSEIWKIVLTIISSVGGIGTIICFVVKFSTNIIADRLSKKYEQKLQKEIEKYKTLLENKSYISRTRFNKEFEIYQQLSEKVLDMTFANYDLFPPFDNGTYSKEEKMKLYNDRYKKAVRTYNEANRLIKSTAPFVSEDIYEAFSKLRDFCYKQIDDYVIFFLEADSEKFQREAVTEYRECWKRTKEIIATRDETIKKLRDYLSKLDVLE